VLKPIRRRGSLSFTASGLKAQRTTVYRRFGALTACLFTSS